MNLRPLFKNYVVYITIAALSGTCLQASETEKSIFKSNQAKTPDFSMLENQQKASIIESLNPSVFNNNNLDLSRNNQNQNRRIRPIVVTNNKSFREKQKNWLYDDVEKIKEARLERSKPKDENPSLLPESYYKKPDIFSLGINQGITQSIQDYKTTATSQQLSSIDFKPAIVESSFNSAPDLSSNESILGTSSSLQIGLQNINERPSNRGMLDTSSPPLLDDNLATTKLNSPINDFTNLKANSAIPQLHQSSNLPSQNFKTNPLNLNASNSFQNLSDRNKMLNPDSLSNPFSSHNFNINKLLTPSTNTSPKVFGNPNLNPNKIQDPLERLYR